MKKILSALAAALLFACALPLTSSAQGQAYIVTRKDRLADFSLKTTKVVLTGNEILDEALKDEVISRWRIAPYEFCTRQEFETLKTSEDYYFLMSVLVQQKNETTPGISMLTLVKGGPAAKDGIGKMLEVASVPFRASGSFIGREIVFLPAILDLVQDLAMKAIQTGSKADKLLSKPTANIFRASGKKIYFAQGDLSPLVKTDKRPFGASVLCVDDEEADAAFSSGNSDAIVSYTVAPEEPEKGSVCYNMLFDAATHELYYIKKRRLGDSTGKGFQPSDLKKVPSRL